MAQSNLEVVISATDRFTGTANRVIGTLGRMESGAYRVGKGIGQVGIGLGRVGLIAAGAAAGGLIAVAKASINWESALAGVNKTMDLTPGELQEIGTEIRNLATTIPLSATSIAGLVEQAGALGIAKNDVVEFARVAATIGVTTNVSADQAASSLGVMSNLLGLTGQDFERFASTLVDLGNKGASTEAQILGVAERAAGASSTIGMSAESLLGWASAVANIGMEPEAGGSSLQRFFLETMKMVNAGGKDLGLIAKVAGVTRKEITDAFEGDPSKALETFVIGLSKLTKGERIDVLESLGFSDIRIQRMLLGLAEAEEKNDNLSNSLNVSADAWSANTAAAEEADKRYGTVASKLTLLKNQGIEAMLLIGEGFLPALGRAADKLKTILADPKGREGLRDLGRDIGEMIDKIDWQKVIDGARTVVDLIKSIVGWIGKVPPEILAGFAGLVGLNKLSGGLIGSGLGNIFGGLSQGAARGLAAKIPGIGSVFAQPVYVTNWPMGGLGGGSLPAAGGAGASALAGGLLPVTIAAIAPLALVGLTVALAGGPEAIARRDLAARRETAARRGLNADKVPAGTVPPRVAIGDAPKITGAIYRTSSLESRDGDVAADRVVGGLQANKAATLAAKAATAILTNKTAAVGQATRNAITAAKQTITQGGHQDKSAIIGAIRANRPSFTVITRVMVQAGVNYQTATNIVRMTRAGIN